MAVLTEEYTEITKKEHRVFHPQEFLIKNWKYFAPISYKRHHHGKKYEHLTPIYSKMPHEINNRLMGTEKIKDFMNVDRSGVLSYLIPMIRLYKVYNDGTEIPFKLEAHHSVAEVRKLSKSTSAMLGAALGDSVLTAATEFSWERSGNTPAEWRTNVVANLKFTVSHPHHLNTPYYGDDEGYMAIKDGQNLSPQELKDQNKNSKIIELLMHSNPTIPNPNYVELVGPIPDYLPELENPTIPNPDYYKIKAVVGWKVSKDNPPPKRQERYWQRIAEQQTTVLSLSVVTHSMDFGVDSSHDVVNKPMSFNVEYRAAVSSVLTEISAFRGPTSPISLQFEKAELQEEYSSIISDLNKRGNIYYHNIVKRDIPIKNKEGEDTDDHDAVFEVHPDMLLGRTMDDQMREILENTIGDEEIPNLKNMRTGIKGFPMHWFYMGDLIDVVLGRVYENNQVKDIVEKVKFLVGTVVLNERIEKKNADGVPVSLKLIPYSINICDLPVSLETFTRWFRKEVLDVKLKDFSVSYFLDKIFNSLIKGAFGPQTDVSTEVTIPQLSFTTFSLPNKNRQDPIFQTNFPGFPYHISETLFSGLNNTAKTGKAHTHYYLINSINGRIGTAGTGDEGKDAKRGVPHINYFSDIGPFESVKFNKIDSPGLKNALIRREINNDPRKIGQLRNLYNASFGSLACPSLMPGTIVYLNPKSVGMTEGLSYLLGIGSYFMIMSSRSSTDFLFSFKTELDCQHLAFADSEEPEPIEVSDFDFIGDTEDNIPSISKRVEL
jgi:hypothetical protein